MSIEGGTDSQVSRFKALQSPEEFTACHRLAEALLPAHRLRALLGSANGLPSGALGISVQALTGPGIGLTEKQATRLAEAIAAPLPKGFLERSSALGAWAIVWSDSVFPSGLAPLSDSPPLLFIRGTLEPEDSRSVAIVGSRRATPYGRGQADRFARAFVEQGLTIVSGGAAGIDTAAHLAVVNGGGRTIAVLGCGIDIAYPSENRSLFDRIAEGNGAVISEFALGTRPEPWRFPTRNRIIAGISRATLVIESPEGSGALLTSTDAARYGRDVWAVPGPVDGGRSRGCHRLIQEGAGLADCPEDLFESLGLASPLVASNKPADSARRSPRPKTTAPFKEAPLPFTDTAVPAPPDNLSLEEQRLLAELSDEPHHLDVAGERAGLAAAQATVAATLLEMKQLVTRLPGGLYKRR